MTYISPWTGNAYPGVWRQEYAGVVGSPEYQFNQQQRDIKNAQDSGDYAPQANMSGGAYYQRPVADGGAGGGVSPSMANGTYDPVTGIYRPNVPASSGGEPAGSSRPWYMNFDDATIQQMIKVRPDLAANIPQSVMLNWSNDFFVANPLFQSILPPERRATFGTGALAPTNGTPAGYSRIQPIDNPAAHNTDFGLPAPGSTAAGDKTGVITRGGPTGAGLTEGGVTTPLAPGLAAPITGAQMPTYRSQGGVPIYSSQALARMTPGERTLLGTTVNRAGGNAEDYFSEQRKTFSAPQGGGSSYTGGRRY